MSNYEERFPEQDDYDRWLDHLFSNHPEQFIVSHRRRRVILADGSVWDVELTAFLDGHIEVDRTQREDTCLDLNTIPF